MMRRAFNVLRRLRSSHDGVAAVEFAIIIPVLVTLILGVVQYGGMVIANQQLHNGVASGAMYVMRGGSDATATQAVALSAWPNKPTDAKIQVSTYCTCAGVTSVCTSLCADNSYPQAFTSISGSGTYAGLFGTRAMSATQLVRTQ